MTSGIATARTGEEVMKTRLRKLLLIGIFSAALHSKSATAQSPGQQPQQQPSSDEMQDMHQHMNIPVVKPELPRLGRAQENPSGKLIQLEELEKMALEKNPTLVQANAEIA